MLLLNTKPVTRISRLALASGLLAATWGCGLVADDNRPFPAKSIDIVVGFGPGGGTDLIARAVSKSLEQQVKSSVVVVNKPGAAGVLAAQVVARSKADGYTLLAAGGSETTSASFYRELPYDPVESFEPIARITATGMLMVVQSNARWDSLESLVGEARKAPGAIKFASSGHGGLFHSAMLAFSNEAGISLTHVPFDGGAASLAALMGGHVDVCMAMPAEADALISGGGVRALAVTSAEPTPLAPGVPTLRELGYDLALLNQKGLVAPAGTPADRLAILEDAVRSVCNDPQFAAEAKRQKMQVAYLGAQDFREALIEARSTIGNLLPKVAGN
ncbi:Tripartite tricarboxylate transporter family receptor [Posidoniimonas polymericola]|uniref:Tripartite tricarboxylate transporter family receptor n=1 Tax=Posidoniimonas polymericola TaxID=2528002 RepID=A0A5C5XW61_9BACT|nr:tripartite tricarboxylate transporter substrate binding protein [Posidoniimonas polymericola]TWT66938.1 Tripartite tricarboxylate transporter family receptor [Posidoniimonas polymericola]